MAKPMPEKGQIWRHNVKSLDGKIANVTPFGTMIWLAVGEETKFLPVEELHREWSLKPSR